MHLKLVSASNEEQVLTIELKAAKRVLATKAYTLHASKYEPTNSSSNPEFIRPMESVIEVSGGSWKHAVPGLTIEVLDTPGSDTKRKGGYGRCVAG